MTKLGAARHTQGGSTHTEAHVGDGASYVHHPALDAARERWAAVVPPKYVPPTPKRKMLAWQEKKARAMHAAGIYTHAQIAEECEITYGQARDVKRGTRAERTIKENI